MPLPNLIVIGASKCGTTSLHRYLARHPQIAMSRDKELDFFIVERNWPKGVEWYSARFPAGTAIRGESSPSYTRAPFYSGVPPRMHAIVPDARLVYMVRDPVDRIVSNWIHATAQGDETRPLAEAVHDDYYFARSLYWYQISAYLEYYPRARILVLAMVDLANDRRAALRRVYEFLDVDPDFPGPARDIRKNRTASKRLKTPAGAWIEQSWVGRSLEALPQRWYWRLRDPLYWPFSRRVERPALSGRDRAELAELLREDANRFREFAGREFADWCV
jgi:hypothetical protein